jgi:hypothetical protein
MRKSFYLEQENRNAYLFTNSVFKSVIIKLHQPNIIYENLSWFNKGMFV